MLLRFKSISGLLGLSRLEWNGDDFSQQTLIYGWNGTGKTTLSNILYCLENKYLVVEDFETLDFKLETDSNETVTQNQITSNSLLLRVFNEQFINDNVRFDGTGSRPIIMIGDSNIKLLEEIDSDTKKLDAERKGLKVLEDESKKTVDTDALLSAAAKKWRQIATDLNVTGDNYFGSVFKVNQVRDLLSTAKITEENIESLSIDAEKETDARNAIKSDWTRVVIEDTPELDLKSLYESANTLLKVTVKVRQLPDIESLNKAFQDWVEAGLAHHKGLDKCAFCTNPIPENRLGDLAQQFTDLLAQTQQDIDSAVTSIDTTVLDSPVTDSSILMPVEQKVFSKHKIETEESAEIIRSSLKELRNALVNKKADITNEDKKYNAVTYPAADIKAFNAANNKVTDSIKRHNTLVENIDSENQTNLNTLLLNCISKDLITENYFTNLNQNNELVEKVKKLEIKVVIASENLETKKDKINDQKKAVEKINALLGNFFANSKIHFKPIEHDGLTTYNIIRNGKVAKNLSQGEKSVIALSYFLVSLVSSKSGDIANSIIVIDDPVDSQDSNFLFRTYGIIKRCTKGAKQIIVLTHSYEFFNVVRDWFTNTRGVEGSLLHIERVTESSGEVIKIDNLPPLLRDYKTEYHYLFCKLYGYVYKSDLIDSPLVANVARKTLEYFSSFKWCCRDSVDFGNRIQSKFLNADSTPEERAIGDAIYKFVNEYSHALDPFRPVNVTDSEAKDIATNALKFIKESDDEHYKVLEKQCNKFYEPSPIK